MKAILIALLVFASVCGYGQSKEVRAFVRVKKNTCCILVKHKAQKRQVKLPSTTSFKSTQKVTVDGVDYTGDMIIEKRAGELISVTDPSIKDSPFVLPKTLKANITQSKDTLYLNFWIQPPTVINRDIHTVQQDTSRDEKTGNYIYPQINEKYYIILENRQSHFFPTSAFEIGALTIPFKYRFGSGSIDPEITTDIINLNLFAGWQIGGIKYWYNKYETAIPTKWSLTVGPFIGLAKETLNKNNTTTALADPKDVGTFSFGGSVLANIADIRIGLHLGIDHAYGKYREQWNYQNRLWLGFGIGFKLPYFKKTE